MTDCECKLPLPLSSRTLCPKVRRSQANTDLLLFRASKLLQEEQRRSL